MRAKSVLIPTEIEADCTLRTSGTMIAYIVENQAMSRASVYGALAEIKDAAAGRGTLKRRAVVSLAPPDGWLSVAGDVRTRSRWIVNKTRWCPVVVEARLRVVGKPGCRQPVRINGKKPVHGSQ